MNKKVLRALNQKPIAYYPIYRKITGSTTAGILLSQLMYWFGMGYDTFFKTDKDIISETFLTEDELKGAKRKLKKLSFLKIERKGLPAKTYYTIDWDEFEKMLEEATDYIEENPHLIKGKSHDTDGGNSTNYTEEIPQTLEGKSHGHIYKENTKENTEEITKETTKETTKEITYRVAQRKTEEAKRVADYLHKKIKEFKPNAKLKPDKWVKDIELAIRIDGRTEKELIGCIEWIYSTKEGSFWIPNIMSGKKLREKFDTMEAQMMRSSKKFQAHKAVNEFLRGGEENDEAGIF